MFKNILIPTDGSPLSQKAARKGVALAKAVGAKVTAFFAAPPATPIVYRNHLPVGFAQPGEHEQMIEQDGRQVPRLHRARGEEGRRPLRERARHQRLSRGRHPEDRREEEMRPHRHGDARPGRPARRVHRQRHAEGAEIENSRDGRSLTVARDSKPTPAAAKPRRARWTASIAGTKSRRLRDASVRTGPLWQLPRAAMSDRRGNEEGPHASAHRLIALITCTART